MNFKLPLASLAFTLLAACAAPGVTLPRLQAWVEGRRVEYVTTDISDAAMAKLAGVNHVPRLAGAIGVGGSSLTERVYKFTDGAQISIFASGPAPAGSAPDVNYSPLWRLVLVHWKPGRPLRELRSEEAVLAAADAGDVELTVTGIVVNCPIVDGLRR